MSITREQAATWFATTHPPGPAAREMYRMSAKALRPFSREHVEKVWRGGWIAVREAVGGYKCSRCKAEAVLDCNDEFVLDNFCPRCGAAMTDEAVEITMRRLEALNNETETD